MLTRLKISGVGPAPSMEVCLAPRLNVFTGDNGLGKSFLLDLFWWGLAGVWPHQLNPGILSGRKALPRNTADTATMSFGHRDGDMEQDCDYTFDFRQQEWKYSQGAPLSPPMIVYGMVDGSFAVLDPLKAGTGIPQSLALSASEVWNGRSNGNESICNGLIADWAGWQKEKGDMLQALRDILATLSPEGEPIVPGELARISLNDARDIPTIRMPYSQGNDIPVVHAASAIKRILSIAYMLLRTWREHLSLCKLVRCQPCRQIMLMIDEIEAHLHPRWQRTVLPALMKAVQNLTGAADVQVVVSTHSPLVMASCEDIFDAGQDAWHDLDLAGPDVHLTQRTFYPQGDATAWLASDAFDLRSDRSVNNEKLLNEANALLESQDPSLAALRDMRARLAGSFAESDPYRVTWNLLVASKYPEINDTHRQ